MFQSCANITTIYVGDGWNMENVTGSGNMFIGCTSLVGQNGTAYNSTITTAIYAVVDGSLIYDPELDEYVPQPGYLTYKEN